VDRRFANFAAIDWSGAKGSKHRGIAVAQCRAGIEAPILVAPPDGRFWSRQAVAQWVMDQSPDTVIGFDFSFAPPFLDRGAYLPGDTQIENATDFWCYVESTCDDEDLGAASFLEVTHRPHFYLGAADGRKADFLRLRRCEALYNARGGGKPSTIFDAIGAAQVAKASFAGMRLLNAVRQRATIWPIDVSRRDGPMIIEIYTQIAARATGIPKGRSKIRDAASLDTALVALDTKPHQPLARYDDHATDAIITAAWLRQSVARPQLWSPPTLTSKIASTEGWTFGVI
jgi:hypothetical protein